MRRAGAGCCLAGRLRRGSGAAAVCAVMCLGGAQASSVPAAGPALGLIIDDLGNNRSAGEAVLALPTPIVAGILPGTPYARRLARSAAEQGREVLLHLPMESEEDLPLGPNSVRAGMPGEAIGPVLSAALRSVPNAIGVSNHMGSLLTGDGAMMQRVMAAILAVNPALIYVDSRTSRASVAFQQARRQGLAATRRDVFLDHDPSPDAVRHQLEVLLHRARRHGSALGIAHPYPTTLEVLGSLSARLEMEGMRLLPLSEFVRLRGAPRSTTAAVIEAPNRAHPAPGQSLAANH